jgi:hypothetical protein
MNRYEDIIDLPHYEPKRHPRMKPTDRAAQFSPFAALTGYEGAVKETARLAARRVELSEDELARLDEVFRQLQERIAEHPEVSITYFAPDNRKTGGHYVTVTGRVQKTKDFERQIVLGDGTAISFEEIVEIG